MLLPAQSWFRSVRFEFLKELHQTIDQSTPASDDMETAFVLVIFENLVQATFELIHRYTPSAGFKFVDNHRLPAIKDF